MLSNKITHPCCRCHQFSSRSLFNEIQVCVEPCSSDFVAVDVVKVCVNEWNKTWKVVALSSHNLLHSHFLIRVLLVASGSKWSLATLTAHTLLINFVSVWHPTIGLFAIFVSVYSTRKHGSILNSVSIVSFLKWSHMASEKELALRRCIPAVRSLHVGIHSAERNIKIQIKRQNDPSQKHSK